MLLQLGCIKRVAGGAQTGKAQEREGPNSPGPQSTDSIRAFKWSMPNMASWCVCTEKLPFLLSSGRKSDAFQKNMPCRGVYRQEEENIQSSRCWVRLFLRAYFAENTSVSTYFLPRWDLWREAWLRWHRVLRARVTQLLFKSRESNNYPDVS